MCKTHTEVARQQPPWGTKRGAQKFIRAALCCEENGGLPERAALPLKTNSNAKPWDIFVDGETTKARAITWEAMNDECAGRTGMRLCERRDLCASKVPKVSVAAFATFDNWVAVGDADNQWVSFLSGRPMCKTYTELARKQPPWGTQGGAQKFIRAALCCEKNGGLPEFNQLIDPGPIVNTSSLGVERVRSRRRLAHSSVGSQSFASFVPLITVFVLGLVFRAYSRHASSASWAVRPSSERDATVHAATPLVSCETSAHLRGPYGASV